MVKVKSLLFAASALISGIVAAPLSAGSVEARDITADANQVAAPKSLERRVLAGSQATDLNNILENQWVYGSRARRESSISVTNLSGCTVLVFWASDWAPSAFHILCGNERTDAEEAYKKINTQGGRIGEKLDANGVSIAYWKEEYLNNAIDGLKAVNPSVNIINKQIYSKSTTAGQKVKFTISKGSNVLNQGLSPSQGEPQTRSIHSLDRRVIDGPASDPQNIGERQYYSGRLFWAKNLPSVRVTDLSGCTVIVFWDKDLWATPFHITCGEELADAEKAYNLLKGMGTGLDAQGATIAYDNSNGKHDTYDNAVAGLKKVNSGISITEVKYYWNDLKAANPGKKLSYTIGAKDKLLEPNMIDAVSNQDSQTKKIRSVSNLETRALASGQTKNLQDIRENQWVYGNTVRNNGGTVKVTDLSGCSALIFWASDWAPSTFHILCGEGARADAKKAYQYVQNWGEEFDEDLMANGISIAYYNDEYLSQIVAGLKDANSGAESKIINRQIYNYDEVAKDYPGERVTIATSKGSNVLTQGHAPGGSNQPSKM